MSKIEGGRMSEYKRFTDKNKIEEILQRLSNDIVKDEDYNFVSTALDYLAELEDKRESGQLIELPCKVGDTVYVVYDRCDGHNCPYNGHYGQWRCNYNGEDRCEAFIDEKKFQYSMLTEIDKTVFVTKEAAEARLEEMKEKK